MNAALAIAHSNDNAYTEAKYIEERDAIRDTYGDNNAEAGALRDQALAALFYRTCWTQERLAKVEGMSQSNMAKRLQFGRFIAFIHGVNIPKNLSFRRFLNYWERSDKDESNERIRFRAVQTMLADEVVVRAPRRTGLSKEILDQFADGKWHDITTIAKAVDEPAEGVASMLTQFGATNNSYGVALCEKKQRGKSFQYRIERKSKSIDVRVLMKDLGPILDGLKAEGRKNAATASPDTVAHLAHQLEQLLERLAK